MKQPAATASKSQWRSWARTLDPVPTAVTSEVVALATELVAGLRGPILGYVALPDEVECPAGATVLPRLDDDGSMSLRRDESPLERHRSNIDQPPSSAEVVDPSAIVAAFVPGRVFDRDGYRLGRGGGHYDRLLPQLGPNAPIIGITCTERLVDSLPREAHDVPMTHLVTEHHVISTR